METDFVYAYQTLSLVHFSGNIFLYCLPYIGLSWCIVFTRLHQSMVEAIVSRSLHGLRDPVERSFSHPGQMIYIYHRVNVRDICVQRESSLTKLRKSTKTKRKKKIIEWNEEEEEKEEIKGPQHTL